MRYNLAMKSLLLFLAVFPLFASADMLGRLNDWRFGQGMPNVEHSDALCEIASIRLSDIQQDFSHAGLRVLIEKRYGYWYENLAREGWRIRGERGVFNAWLRSPKHKDILQSDMQYVCILNEGKFWVLLGFSPI